MDKQVHLNRIVSSKKRSSTFVIKSDVSTQTQSNESLCKHKTLVRSARKDFVSSLRCSFAGHEYEFRRKEIFLYAYPFFLITTVAFLWSSNTLPLFNQIQSQLFSSLSLFFLTKIHSSQQIMTFNDLLLSVILLHMCLSVNVLVIFILSIFLFLILYVFWGRNGSPDVPKKLSPRAARPLKLAALETDSSSSAISANNRIPKDTSPKVSDRKPSPSPFSEKKRPSRITELESLVSQLQGELKKAKHQVSVSETSKKQAKQEAEESKKQLQEVSSKLQETKNQVLEEETDKTGAFNHRSVSQGWDLEFGATSTNERGRLAVVVQEIRQLKLQIEMVASSEADHVKQAELRNSEIQLLRGNLMDTLFLVENFSNQLKDCEVTDAETKALATETLRQMENAKKAVEELKSDGTKAVDSYKKMAVELEQSKSRMVWLGGLVTKLLANPGVLENHETLLKDYASLKLGESNEMKDEISSLRCEVERLRAALEASGKNDQEGNVKASSRLRIQAELRFELRTAKSKIDKLEARLVGKETELKFISEENDNLCLLLKKNQKETDAEAELKQQREVIKKLKADLMDKETQLQIVSDQNETLKSDIHKRETDIQDVLMKLGFAMREAEKSSQRAVRVTEQLDATQASNSAMETELDKLKARLVAKETELQFISDETDNVYLLLKNQKETDAEAEAELKQQREVIEKLKADLMDKETQLQIVSDKNETLKSEMGTELRELQVQSNQLREAAEKANAMLSAGNNNNQRNSSYSEDIDDEVQRRKQGISLRRLVFGGRSRRNGWRLTE
ncbi:unnamed protein product [Brassica oleracea]